ncbi:18018_t:CDS:1, partial [Dentiscutata erythropus]
YNKDSITELHDPISKKWAPDKKLKKVITVKRDVSKKFKAKKDKPELFNWHQRSVEKRNIKGYLKAQARIGPRCEDRSRAKKNSNISLSIYNQKLDQVPDTNFKNQPKPDKQG